MARCATSSTGRATASSSASRMHGRTSTSAASATQAHPRGARRPRAPVPARRDHEPGGPLPRRRRTGDDRHLHDARAREHRSLLVADVRSGGPAGAAGGLRPGAPGGAAEHGLRHPGRRRRRAVLPERRHDLRRAGVRRRPAARRRPRPSGGAHGLRACRRRLRGRVRARARVRPRPPAGARRLRQRRGRQRQALRAAGGLPRGHLGVLRAPGRSRSSRRACSSRATSRRRRMPRSPSATSTSPMRSTTARRRSAATHCSPATTAASRRAATASCQGPDALAPAATRDRAVAARAALVASSCSSQSEVFVCDVIGDLSSRRGPVAGMEGRRRRSDRRSRPRRRWRER